MNFHQRTSKAIFSVKLKLFSWLSVQICVLGAQKNRLIEMVLFSTLNICFGLKIRKIILIMQPYLRHVSLFQKNKRKFSSESFLKLVTCLDKH